MMSRRDCLFALALLIVTFLVYAPAWNGRPIWDDEIHITSPELRSLNGLAQIWTEPSAAPQYYPLLHTLFWLEDKLWDGSVLPYHLVTIFAHALLAILLVPILRWLDLAGAWLAAFVFALHPVHVESVAWLSEIKNTLSGVFGAAALLAYLHYDDGRHWRAYFAALALFVAGLLTKTVIVVLPAVILVLFWWKRGSLKTSRDVLPLVAFFGLALVAGVVTIWVEQKFCANIGETFEFTLLDRFLAGGRLFWFYLGNIFWPVNLCLIYPRWTVDPGQWWQYVFPVSVIALFAGLWSQRDKARGVLAAALCFLVILLPVLSFFNLSFFMSSAPPMRNSAIFRADHFQYLADIPIIALVCAVGATLWSRSRRPARVALSTLCLIAFALLGFATSMQSRTYRDNETCFRSVLAKNPDSATAHNNVANILLRKGSLDEAVLHYRRTLKLEPGHQSANYNLAAALVQHGDLDEAIIRLKSILRENPNDAHAYNTLADALSKQGARSEAIAYYGRALRLVPDFPEAHTNLANLLLETGNTAGALEHYREALRLQPNNPQMHYNVAVGLVRNGQPDAAIPELRTALQLDPNYPDAGPLLRDLLAQKQR
jgi:Flp pilus assembly protein TadD